MKTTETLVIGSGIAGAATAYQLAQDPTRKVTVITRASDPQESNTRYAQGGIVAQGIEDSPDLLYKDIIAAGAGASDPKAARILAEEGAGLVDRLLVEAAGVPFDREADGSLVRGREAAHSVRRIYHVGDGTGQAIIIALLNALKKLPNVEIVTESTAIDLITFPHHTDDPLTVYDPITCHGAYIFNQKTKHVNRYLAENTVLATGGIGRVFMTTTNPVGSRGDGLAMAYRAGARLANCEYIQFHPTSLAVHGARGFLISEAVRGEGGVLLTPDGRAFMAEVSPEWKDLAPRDVVALAIYKEMEQHGYPHVLLDIASHMPADEIPGRFPNIYEGCLKVGIDITTEPIPVVPAAHYFCGGVLADEYGQTSIRGLYAIGEVSCTGLHGANRLASTSLLEGLVWGNRAAKHIAEKLASDDRPTLPSEDQVMAWDESGLIADYDPALVQGDMQTIQNIMWHYVGLVRNTDRLSRAMRELRHLWGEINSFYKTTKLNDGLIGLRNSAEVALIIARAAYHNPVSRGCHNREDG